MVKEINLAYKDLSLKISYELQKGSEESIVFIHGLGVCKECFQGVWGFPGFEQYTILTFDLPGFGDSDKPAEFSYTMEDQAVVSKLLIQELGLKQVHVVGHSMGGSIGLLLTQEIISITKSFICLEGNLVSKDCTGSRIAISYSLEDFQKEGFQKLKAEILEIGDHLLLGCLSKCDPYAFYKSSQSLVEWSDSGKLLNLFLKLDAHKYYIYGKQNEDMPLIKQLESVPRLVIPNSGHGMMTDNPQDFYNNLLESIQTL